MPLEAGSLFPSLVRTATTGDAGPSTDGPTVLWGVFKTECPTCALTFPYWRTLSAAGVPLLAVAQNIAHEVQEFVGDDGPGPVIRLDDAPYPASTALGVQVTPTLFVVENGTITQVIEAWQRDTYTALAERLGVRLGLVIPYPRGFPSMQYG